MTPSEYRMLVTTMTCSWSWPRRGAFNVEQNLSSCEGCGGAGTPRHLQTPGKYAKLDYLPLASLPSRRVPVEAVPGFIYGDALIAVMQASRAPYCRRS